MQAVLHMNADQGRRGAGSLSSLHRRAGITWISSLSPSQSPSSNMPSCKMLTQTSVGSNSASEIHKSLLQHSVTQQLYKTGFS